MSQPDIGGSRPPHFAELARRLTTVYADLVASLAATDRFQAQLDALRDIFFVEVLRALSKRGIQKAIVARMFGIGPSTLFYRQKTAQSELARGLARRELYERAQAVLSVLPDALPDAHPSAKTHGVPFEELEEHFVSLRDLSPAGDDDGPEPITFRADELRSLLQTLVKEGLVRKSHKRWVRLGTLQVARPGLYDVGAVVFHLGPITVEEVAERLALGADEVRAHLDAYRERGLLIEGRDEEGGPTYQLTTFRFERGEDGSAEAGLYDHFATMCRVIAAKADGGSVGARPGEHHGGSTFTFYVPPGAPIGDEIKAFLDTSRTQLERWLDATSAYGPDRPENGPYERVTIYLGQAVARPEE
jgi:DNA-binding transcriptional ArsR family regulator